MAFYNIHNLRVGVAIDNDINGINKGEFVFYQCCNDYNSKWPVSSDIITAFTEVHQKARHAEDSYLNHILDIDLAVKNLPVNYLNVLNIILTRGKGLVKMLEDRRTNHFDYIRSEHLNDPLPINSEFLKEKLKYTNGFTTPYELTKELAKEFSLRKCTAIYSAMSDVDLYRSRIFSARNSFYGVMPVTLRSKEDLKASIHEDAKRVLNEYFGKTFDYAISAENALEMIEKKEENYMRNFLKNIEYLEVSAKRSILEATNRRKSYAIYYPEMEITDSIADELIFILMDMHSRFTCHKVIFNPEKGTTTCYTDGRHATVKCHGDDEFSFSKGYLAALVKACKHGKMNWLSEIKNHRKVHILPKLEN